MSTHRSLESGFICQVAPEALPSLQQRQLQCSPGEAAAHLPRHASLWADLKTPPQTQTLNSSLCSYGKVFSVPAEISPFRSRATEVKGWIAIVLYASSISHLQDLLTLTLPVIPMGALTDYTASTTPRKQVCI